MLHKQVHAEKTVFRAPGVGMLGELLQPETQSDGRWSGPTLEDYVLNMLFFLYYSHGNSREDSGTNFFCHSVLVFVDYAQVS